MHVSCVHQQDVGRLLADLAHQGRAPGHAAYRLGIFQRAKGGQVTVGVVGVQKGEHDARVRSLAPGMKGLRS